MKSLKRILWGTGLIALSIIAVSIAVNMAIDNNRSIWLVTIFAIIVLFLFFLNFMLYVYLPLVKVQASLRNQAPLGINELANKRGIVGELAGLLKNYISSELNDDKIQTNFINSDINVFQMALNNAGLDIIKWDFSKEEYVAPSKWSFLVSGKTEELKTNIFSNINRNQVYNVGSRFKKVIDNKIDSFKYSFKVIDPLSDSYWISLSLLVLTRDDQNLPVKMIGLVKDISEEISDQQKLLKTKELAEESNRVKTLNMLKLSHKVRTPMNAIFGFSQLLFEENIPIEEKEVYVNIIRKDTDNLLALIDDMINNVRSEDNYLAINKSEIQINRMLDNLNEEFAINEKSEQVRLMVNTTNADDITIISDESILKSILNQLINNAYKFTEKGKIEVGYSLVHSNIEFYVKDTGTGISEEDQRLVFGKFYQSDIKAEGTGMGLAICKSMVERLGGEIRFESEVDTGSDFYVLLPIK